MASNKRQRRRAAKRKKAQRQRLMTGGLIGLVALFAVWFAVIRPNGPNTTQNLSEEDLATLPIGPEVGSLAPDFTLADTNGQEVSLSKYRGKPVAMMFFHTW